MAKVRDATDAPTECFFSPVSSSNSRKAAYSKRSLGLSPPPGVAQYELPLNASFLWEKLNSKTLFSGDRTINREDGRVRIKSSSNMLKLISVWLFKHK